MGTVCQTGRIQRGRRAAIAAALSSDFYSHRVGAALLSGSKIVAVGYNQKKTHPDCQECFSVHAEFCVIRRYKDTKGAILFIARLTRTNKISYAKPCQSCQKHIRKAGIAKIFYTNYNGDMEEWKL